MFFDKNSKAHELIDRTIQNFERNLVSHYKHNELQAQLAYVPMWSGLLEPIDCQN